MFPEGNGSQILQDLAADLSDVVVSDRAQDLFVNGHSAVVKADAQIQDADLVAGPDAQFEAAVAIVVVDAFQSAVGTQSGEGTPHGITATPDLSERKEDFEMRWRGRSSVLMVSSLSVVEEILETGFHSSYFTS